MASQTEAIVKNDTEKRKGKKRRKEITVSYINTIPCDVLEKTLANIYTRKVKNGTLII